jgi:AcrR family transcriptional regulator
MVSSYEDFETKVLIMSTSISSLPPGRGRQKARTREAMVAAARALLADGTTPTVEAAAAHAGLSRATAYRYFTNQRELLVATHPMLDMASLLPPDAPAHPRDRVMIVAEAIINLILSSEAELKMSLRLSLEPGVNADLPLRKGRRLIWFEDALQPLKSDLKAATFKRLTHALAASVGVETFVWLVDIVGLSRKEAVEQLLWTARTLMDGATGP